MTLHDYYTLCPSYTLVDPAGQPCGACVGRAPRDRSVLCMTHAGRDPDSVDDYQRHMLSFVSRASRLFVPSATARDVITGRYPELRERLEVEEHGHLGMERVRISSPPPRPRRNPGRLNVAIIGGLEAHKGLEAFRRLLRANRRTDTVFHLYGWARDEEIRQSPGQPIRLDGSWLVYHGPYASSDIVSTLRADEIHVGLHLAIWEETFSFTLSEFAAARIPVIAGDFGAQGERVRRCGLGWTVADPRASGEILAILDRIIDEPEAWSRVAENMRQDLALPAIESTWKRYAGAYRELVQGDGANMKDQSDRQEPDFSRAYVSFLARRLAEGEPPDVRTREELAQARAEVEALKERLRSPRHRVADAGARILHRIPVVWPLVAKATDAVLRRQRSPTSPASPSFRR